MIIDKSILDDKQVSKSWKIFLFQSVILFSQNQSPNLTLFGQKHNSQRYSVDDKLFSIWYVNTASYSQMTPARILAVNSSLNGSQKVTEGITI